MRLIHLLFEDSDARTARLVEALSNEPRYAASARPLKQARMLAMAKKAKRPRGSNDSALSGFKALQHVIEVTEGKPKKKPAKRR